MKPDPSGQIAAPIEVTPKPVVHSPTAYDIFKKTIKRAQNLVRIHREGSNLAEKHFDCFRGAVVLSISALDAYVRTLVVDELMRVISNTDKQLQPEIKEHFKNLMSHEALLEAARCDDFKGEIDKAIRKDLDTKSFQGEHSIEKYMKLAGHPNIMKSVSQSADINEEKFRREIADVTNRRHIIAHRGDFDLNKVPPTENSITREYAEKCIQVVSIFAEHIDKVTKK